MYGCSVFFNPQTFGNAEKRFFHDEVNMMIFYLVRAMRVDNEFLFSTKLNFLKILDGRVGRNLTKEI